MAATKKSTPRTVLQPVVKKPNRPPIHVLIYGHPGSGKSTFAASFPRPIYVAMFDPFGKHLPYVKGATETVSEGGVVPTTMALFPPNEERDEPDVDIEHFVDGEYPPKPGTKMAYTLFRENFHNTLKMDYATIVIDSITMMAIAARKESQYFLNPSARDPRQWYGHATEMLEECLMVQCGSVNKNVVVIAHVSEEKDELHGSMVRNPAAPGRMRTGIAAAFGEFYRSWVEIGEKGEQNYRIQTKGDRVYNCTSAIEAPNNCVAHYDNLWT